MTIILAVVFGTLVMSRVVLASSYTFDFRYPDGVGSPYQDAIPLSRALTCGGPVKDANGFPVGFSLVNAGDSDGDDRLENAVLDESGLRFVLAPGDGDVETLVGVPFPTTGSNPIKIIVRYASFDRDVLNAPYDQSGIGWGKFNATDGGTATIHALGYFRSRDRTQTRYNGNDATVIEHNWPEGSSNRELLEIQASAEPAAGGEFHAAYMFGSNGIAGASFQDNISDISGDPQLGQPDAYAFFWVRRTSSTSVELTVESISFLGDHLPTSNAQRAISSSLVSSCKTDYAAELTDLNAGPPEYDGSWGAPFVQQDNHVSASFSCFVPSGSMATSGDIEVVSPPDSVTFDAYESNTAIRVFEEQTNVVLTEDVTADFAVPGLYDDSTDFPTDGVVLAAGTPVLSHFFHFDTVGSDPQTLTCSVTFDSDIVGVCIEEEALDATDGLLGASSTVYPTGRPRRAWEIDGEIGEIEISPDRRTLSLTGFVDQWNDQIRVLTAGNAIDPLSMPYVNSTSYMEGVDEVTLDNCSSAWYRFTFDLPVGYEGPSLCGTANVDDVGILYLNGNRITPLLLPTDTFGTDRDEGGSALLSAPTPDLFGTSEAEYFQSGENELVFGVFGDAASDPTGLEFMATVAYDTTAVTGVNEATGPTRVFLGPMHPNPMQSTFWFSVNLPRAGEVSLKVYDVAGRLVDTAYDGTLAAGPHELSWSKKKRDLSAGVYFLRLDALGRSETRRFLLLK